MTKKIVVWLPLLALLTLTWGCHRERAGFEPLLGVEAFEAVPPVYDRGAGRVRNAGPGDETAGLSARLSRSRYWAEDGHLDVLVQLQADDGIVPDGILRIVLGDSAGNVFSRFEFTPPGPRFVFYPAIPPTLADGGAAEIHLAWIDAEALKAEQAAPPDAAVNAEPRAEYRAAFRVERLENPAPRQGRIAITLPNEDAVRARGIPFTLGVPFPRGVLGHTDNLRLLDAGGAEHSLQVRETARWSKHGSIKWVQCDFQADLDGLPLEFYLEYGPRVRRRSVSRQMLNSAEALASRSFPTVDAGRLRIDNGVWFDVDGRGRFVKVLDGRALNGAFIEHENGRIYRMAEDAGWHIEEHGTEKVVLQQSGYYREIPPAPQAAGHPQSSGADTFCKYVTRWVFFHDSPVARVFHTWIFTGDGSRDRIANMGWELPLDESFAPDGFLSAFGSDGQWLPGDGLLQYDFRNYEIAAGNTLTEVPGGRAPGAARAVGPAAQLYFGARDFWQNYPAELEFRDGSLWFHNWPRHGKPTRHIYDEEQLSKVEYHLNTVRLRFAHEGEVLDFRRPQDFIGAPEPETANAQGIARTEEFWLYLAPAASDANLGESRRVLEALNQETLRAVADPAWVAASGAFYEMHHRDLARFPEEEAIYEKLALAFERWRERLGIYGKWLYGDLPLWNLSLEARTPDFYRAYMGPHHGWPYCWIPYARSGDARFRRTADAATRQMTDAYYRHYATDAIEQRSGQSRGRGWLSTWVLTWATGSNPRSMLSKTDYLLHAWYLTGYARAHDVLLDWADATRHDERSIPPARESVTLLRSYLETYGATFDPWFLAAAHAIADMHLDRWKRGAWNGHFFRSGDREFHRFSGCDDYREYYLAYAAGFGRHREPNSWMRMGLPWAEPNAYAWELTGDDYYLGRSAAFVDAIKTGVYAGETPEYVQGLYTRAGATFTGWALEQFPTALATVVASGQQPAPLSNATQLRGTIPPIIVRKTNAEPLPLRLSALAFAVHQVRGSKAQYRVTGPNGAEVEAGEWDMESVVQIDIPAEAPQGEYRLEVTDARTPALEVPVSEPGTLEVLMPADGAVPPSNRDPQYYFYVPEGVAEFYMEFPLGARGANTERRIIYDPDGNKVWEVNWHASHYELPEGQTTPPWFIFRRAEISVAPNQAGRVWRVIGGGGHTAIKVDPQIPPVYAAHPDRWFLPQALQSKTQQEANIQ